MKPARMKRSKSLFEVEQPFDLFDDFEMEYPTKQPKEPLGLASGKVLQLQGGWKKGFSLGVIFLALIATVALTIGIIQRYQNVKIPVFVELRALSPKGHPVAGAYVTFNDTRLGVTDSFGEWRRYMKLKENEELTVIIKKRVQDEFVIGRKIIKVPELDKQRNDAEIKINIALSNPSQKQEKVRSQHSPIESANQFESFSTDTPATGNLGKTKTKIDQQKARNAITAGNTTMDVNRESDEDSAFPIQIPTILQSTSSTNQAQSSSAISNNVPMAAVNIQHLSEIDIRYHGMIPKSGSTMANHQSAMLRTRILPEMIAQAEESGLHLTRGAEWRLNLSYLPHHGNVGFVMVDIEWADSSGRKQTNSFMSHFSKTIEDTARNLLKLTALQVSKAYEAFYTNQAWYIKDQSSEHNMWRLSQHTTLIDSSRSRGKLTLIQEKNGHRIWRVDSETSQICGNMAAMKKCMLRTLGSDDRPPLPTWKTRQLTIRNPLPRGAKIFVAGFEAKKVGPQRWTYWADPGKSMNLTIVSQNSIYFRKRITPSFSEQNLALILGKENRY